MPQSTWRELNLSEQGFSASHGHSFTQHCEEINTVFGGGWKGQMALNFSLIKFFLNKSNHHFKKDRILPFIIFLP